MIHSSKVHIKVCRLGNQTKILQGQKRTRGQYISFCLTKPYVIIKKHDVLSSIVCNFPLIVYMNTDFRNISQTARTDEPSDYQKQINETIFRELMYI